MDRYFFFFFFFLCFRSRTIVTLRRLRVATHRRIFTFFYQEFVELEAQKLLYLPFFLSFANILSYYHAVYTRALCFLSRFFVAFFILFSFAMAALFFYFSLCSFLTVRAIEMQLLNQYNKKTMQRKQRNELTEKKKSFCVYNMYSCL